MDAQELAASSRHPGTCCPGLSTAAPARPSGWVSLERGIDSARCSARDIHLLRIGGFRRVVPNKEDPLKSVAFGGRDRVQGAPLRHGDINWLPTTNTRTQNQGTTDHDSVTRKSACACKPGSGSVSGSRLKAERLGHVEHRAVINHGKGTSDFARHSRFFRSIATGDTQLRGVEEIACV